MKTYNIVILGPKGAGKTVYLASLYHKLSTPGDLGYFLSVPTTQGKRLNTLFTDLVKGWPDATMATNLDTWNFTVLTNGQTGQPHEAASVNYYDYGGGRLTRVQDDKVEAETQEMINTGHVFLGLIDGWRLHKEARLRQPVDEEYWNEHVKELCDQMVRVGRKPVHFIVSKWDLFEDSDESLRDVRNLLEAFPPFRNLVEQRKRMGAITRLIPISSVGYGYCELQSDGAMLKRVGARPSPLRVETPFACVLPDLIEDELNKAREEAAKREAMLEQPISVRLGFWESLKVSAGRVLAKVAHVTGLKDPVVEWLIEASQKAAQRKLLEATEQERLHLLEAEQLRKKINDASSATIFVLNSMTNTRTNLESTHPSSVIA